MKNTSRPRIDYTHLDATIEALHEMAGNEDAIHANEYDPKVIERAAMYLEAYAEKMADNKLYHKKQQVKRNIALKALEKMLSADEMKEIDRQADIAIGNIHTPEEAEEADVE